jgi:hypothetical protein
MISILEIVRREQIRGNVRKPQPSLGNVPKYAKKITKIPKEDTENIKIQASLSRNKIPKPKNSKPWVGRFQYTKK